MDLSRSEQPVITTEAEQRDAKRGTNEQDMEFVRKIMLLAKVQDVAAKVDLAGQNHLVATYKSDLHNLRCHSRALRIGLAWGIECLDHVGQRCGWPNVVKGEIAGRIQEIAKTSPGKLGTEIDAHDAYFIGSIMQCLCLMGLRGHRHDPFSSIARGLVLGRLPAVHR